PTVGLHNRETSLVGGQHPIAWLAIGSLVHTFGGTGQTRTQHQTEAAEQQADRHAPLPGNARRTGGIQWKIRIRGTVAKSPPKLDWLTWGGVTRETRSTSPRSARD
ncbi:MAG: hypothetical protein ACK56F_00485, partial [bacterium]